MSKHSSAAAPRQKSLTLTMKILCCVARTAPLLLLVAQMAHADSHTWTGAGLTGNWSIPANWQANNPPAAGETAPTILIFPSGAARPNNTNNISGLVIDGMTISGSNYRIQGAGAGANITFSEYPSRTFSVSGANNVLGSTLTITLSGTPIFSITSTLTNFSRWIGAGGFIKIGNGSLTLLSLSDNTFTGAATINEGMVFLKNGYQLFDTWMPAISIPGPLTIGGQNMTISPSVVLLASSQTASNSPLTILPNGYLYLNGCDTPVSTLTMTGGTLYGDGPNSAAIGTLTLGGNITAPFTSLIKGAVGANLNLGGYTRTIDVQGGTFIIGGVIDDGLTGRGSAGLTKIGSGTLWLMSATNTYNGATLINAGVLRISSNRSLGTTNIGTTVASGAELILDHVNVGNEPLTLNGAGPSTNTGALVGLWTNNWSGAITLASDTTILVSNVTDQITLGNISGTGGVTKHGAGTLIFAGPANNTYGGDTTVWEGNLKLICGYFTGTFPNLTFVPGVAVPGYLGIGSGSSSATVQLLAHSQISASAHIDIGVAGTLDLNNYSTPCGSLTFYGGQAQSGTGTLTLNGDINAWGDLSGRLFGKVSLGGATREINVWSSNGGLILSADISNGTAAAGITKNGPGYLNLNGHNTYSGPTIINNGRVSPFTSFGFGTGAGGVTVNPAGMVLLAENNLAISNITLTLNGSGSATGGSLSSAATGATWAGPVVLASDSFMEGHWPSSQLIIAGPITGTGGLRVGGKGAVTLAGSLDNTFLGALIVDGTNQVYLSKSNGATAVPGSISIGDNNGALSSSAQVLLGGPNQIANSSSVNLFHSGLLHLQSFDETIGSLTFHSGAIQGTGTLTLNGDITNMFNDAALIHCPLSLGGQTRIFNSVAGTIVLFGPVSDGGGSAGLNKLGPGVLELAGPNTYSGLTVVNQGNLYLSNDHGLGSTAAGTVVARGSLLCLFGVNVPSEPLTLGAANGLGAPSLYFSGTNSWGGPVALEVVCHCESGTADSRLTFNAAITGEGGWDFPGRGTMIFSGPGDNTYSGTTKVTGGTLLLYKTSNVLALDGPLIVGTNSNAPVPALVQWLEGHQLHQLLPPTVTVWRSGELDLNNFSDAVGLLFLYGGTITSGAGTLTLRDNIMTPDNELAAMYGSRIYGHLSLGGEDRTFTLSTPLLVHALISDGSASAGIIKEGPSDLALYGNNSYSGPTLINIGGVAASQPASLGSAVGPTTVAPGAKLALKNLGTTAEPLFLAGDGGGSGALIGFGTNICSGPITLQTNTQVVQANTSDLLILSNTISGSGDLDLRIGTVVFTGTDANTYTGTTSVVFSNLELDKPNGINAIPGPLSIGSDLSTSPVEEVRLRRDNQIADTSAVKILSSGMLRLNNFRDAIGDLNGSGYINLGSGRLIVGGTQSSNLFAGAISGSGELDKIGDNKLVLTGHNTYSASRVHGGTLIINGGQAGSDAYVYTGATLGGIGAIRNLYSFGGTISPGGSPGKLDIVGDAILDSATRVVIEINGTTPGTLYDQLLLTGELAANNATLQIVMGFPGAVGNEYEIVNHMAGFTSTFFAGLPEGGTLTLTNGVQFHITYVANGDHNDTILTQLSAPVTSQLRPLVKLGDGNFQLIGTGTPGSTYWLLANTNVATTNWLNIGAAIANSEGTIIFTNIDGTNLSRRFYRLAQP